MKSTTLPDELDKLLTDFVGCFMGADHTYDGARDNYKSQRILHDHLIAKVPEVKQAIQALIDQAVAEVPDRIKGITVSGVPTLQNEMDKVSVQDLRLIIAHLNSNNVVDNNKSKERLGNENSKAN